MKTKQERTCGCRTSSNEKCGDLLRHDIVREPQHTPTSLPEPRNVANNGWQIQFPEQPLVFKDKELAFKIVRAVNSHEALLKAAKLALKHWVDPLIEETPDIEKMLKIAIKQAEGK